MRLEDFNKNLITLDQGDLEDNGLIFSLKLLYLLRKRHIPIVYTLVD